MDATKPCYKYKTLNGFSSQLLSSLKFSLALEIPANSKQLKIRSFSVSRCLDIWTLACSGLTPDSFSVTLKSVGFFPSFSWFTTFSENHLLYFPLIKHLTALLIVICSCWNLFVKLHGTITIPQLPSLSLFCPLNVSIIISTMWFYWQLWRISLVAYSLTDISSSKKISHK